jgi:hypothetical protein
MGVEVATIARIAPIVTETVDPHPDTLINVVTETVPAVGTTTLPAKTRTVTVTLPGPQITETTTADVTTVSTSFTAYQDTLTITQQATEVDKTTSVTTKTRSVGPICTTYTPSQTSCNCKFEVLCDQAVNTDVSTFQRHIDFNTHVGSFEECMQRCDNSPSCQFGDFASLPNGGLCSSYSGNPGNSGTSSQSGSKYFEKGGNVDCSACSS